MSASGQGAPDPPRLDPQNRDLLQFLREENDATRKAARDEADASRGLLRFTVWLVSVPISLMIVTAAFVGWGSLEDIKQKIQIESREGRGRRESRASSLHRMARFCSHLTHDRNRRIRRVEEPRGYQTHDSIRG